ncbi:U6 snRNA (guanine-N(2))-methyltransferase THUMPD2 isoform X2 [Lithobates pipiens]
MTSEAPHVTEESAGVRFFCTAGRGMERFVVDEVTRKVSAVEVETLPGKIFFTGKPDLNTIKNVKSAERMFLLLMKGPPVNLAKHKGNISSVLQKSVIGEPHLWLQSLQEWQNLQKQVSKEAILQGQREVEKRKSEGCPFVSKTKVCKHDTTVKDNFAQYDQTAREAPARSKNMSSKEVNTARSQTFSSENDNTVSFRVSCRCSGGNAKKTTAQVFVHLNDMYSVVGFPILRQPLAYRSYIQNTGLRSTTAWAMVTLAEIGAASCVLDPMCGVGTILLEAAKEWPHASYLGADISDSQLTRALANMKKAGISDSVAFLKGSVLNIPVLSGSIDAVISDIPFGKKFKCSKDMKELLPDIIREMERVLRIGGVIVLLLSQKLHYNLKKNVYFKSVQTTEVSDGKEALLKCKDESIHLKKGCVQHDFQSLVHVESHPVSLGVTEAVMFKCKKT